jgi:hypothetical protein
MDNRKSQIFADFAEDRREKPREAQIQVARFAQSPNIRRFTRQRYVELHAATKCQHAKLMMFSTWPRCAE